MTLPKPYRFPWHVPLLPVWLHAQESVVKKHPAYLAAKAGDVKAARNLVDDVINIVSLIVDDFIGQGGTIANLRGYIMQQGGTIIGATVLTGKDYSAHVTLDDWQLDELRGKHGQLEQWWGERFGFGFDCLTASEARYLGKIRTHEEIRARIESVGA